LVCRIDDRYRELLGGHVEVGESVTRALAVRLPKSPESASNAGHTGVYSDPSHVLVDPDDTINQQLAICLHDIPAAQARAEHPRSDGVETNAAVWFSIPAQHAMRPHA
jgi:hypothetical protein